MGDGAAPGPRTLSTGGPPWGEVLSEFRLAPRLRILGAPMMDQPTYSRADQLAIQAATALYLAWTSADPRFADGWDVRDGNLDPMIWALMEAQPEITEEMPMMFALGERIKAMLASATWDGNKCVGLDRRAVANLKFPLQTIYTSRAVSTWDRFQQERAA